jgi:hypothetical protein
MMGITVKKRVFPFVAALATVAIVGSVAAFASTELTCPNLDMVWHDPESGAVIRSEPYVCGSDLCGGYRCKEGSEISPACYNADQCAAACAGECVYVPTAQLDCETMCGSAGCGVVMTWYKGRTLLRSEPYECALDACAGSRCLDGNEISPACYSASQCAKSCKRGTCVDIQSLQEGDCNADLCSMN